jgi:hypothetical protein
MRPASIATGNTIFFMAASAAEHTPHEIMLSIVSLEFAAGKENH